MARCTRAARAAADSDLARRDGRVSDLIGLIIEATGLAVEIGEVCMVGDGRDREPVACEVVGFRGGRTLLMPLGELHGIGPGTAVRPSGARCGAGRRRAARPRHRRARPAARRAAALDDAAGARRSPRRPTRSSRPRIRERVGLGVRALDALVPCGRGQRLGIFAGSGVGKSSLLGMIAAARRAPTST